MFDCGYFQASFFIFLEVFVANFLFHHSLPLVIKRHSHFFPRAMLTFSGSRIPSPLFSFGAQTMDQLTIWIFFSLSFPPCQRNFRIKLAIAFFIPIRAWRDENWKIGNADNTEFIRTTLLARFNQDAPHILNFSLIF